MKEKFKAKCPECEKIYMSAPFGYGTSIVKFTGRQALPRVICPACKAKNRANLNTFQRSSENMYGKRTRLSRAGPGQRGLTPEEWAKRNRDLEVMAHEAHKNEPKKPIPLWVVRLGETMR